MASKNAYSNQQVDRYLEHINVPQRFRRGAKLDVELLTAIQQHHLCRIPFDDIQIHYSTDRSILLEPEAIFNKFVEKGHGGYCMEHNALIYYMLLALGFEVYTTGARPQKRVDGLPSGNYYGWTHMVDIVTLSDQEMYVVDVGYGGDGAIRPLPLVEGTITPNIGRQEMRLTKDHKGPLVRQSNDLWTYQIRNGTDKPWQTNYVFTEIEFTPQDFRIMSYFTSTHPDSYMVNTLVAVKMLMNDEGEIYGKLMLAGADLKRNTGGRTETLLTCKTEGERVAVLEEHFGIKLSQEERDAIHGSKTRID